VTPTVKPIVQDILQARLDGKIGTIADVLAIIGNHIPGDISYDVMMELTSYTQELLPCDNIEAANDFAKKYGLTIVY
jgi:hypothetical protein